MTGLSSYLSAGPFAVAVLMVSAGLLALVFRRNLIKMVMALHVMGSGADLFLVSLGYCEGGIAPIYTNAPQLGMVLATPQALTLTSIVISFAITALMLSLVMYVNRYMGSTDSTVLGGCER